VLSFIGSEHVGLYWAILAGSSIMFVTGLADDILHFKPARKLFLEVAATSVFVFAGGIFKVTGISAFDIALTYLWFLGIINAVNLLDNMDGVSAGIVILGSIGVWFIGHLGNYTIVPASTWLGLLLAAASLGFWFHNKPPASIFMGDSGSLFLGFVFAGITLPTELNIHYGLSSGTTILTQLQPMFIAVTLAAIPILDTSLVTITRLWRGQSPAVGGRDHSTHRLAQSGLSSTQTLVVLYGLSLICIMCASIMRLSPSTAPFVFGVLFFGFGFTAFYLGCVSIDAKKSKSMAWQQLFNSIHHRIPSIKMAIDVPLIVICFYAAYFLRFDLSIPQMHKDPLFYGTLVALVCCLSVNLSFSVYRFSWRLASSKDIAHYVGCATLGSLLTIAALAVITRFSDGHSRGAIMIFGVIYFLGLLATRFSFRLFDDVFLRFRNVRDQDKKTPVFIYGAGRAGRLLSDQSTHLTELSHYKIVAFVDDDSDFPAIRQSNIPVLTPSKLTDKQLQAMQPEIWVSSPKITDEQAIELARKFSNRALIRRLQIGMTDVNY